MFAVHHVTVNDPWTPRTPAQCFTGLNCIHQYSTPVKYFSASLPNIAQLKCFSASLPNILICSEMLQYFTTNYNSAVVIQADREKGATNQKKKENDLMSSLRGSKTGMGYCPHLLSYK